jgi:hypothetical protein
VFGDTVLVLLHPVSAAKVILCFSLSNSAESRTADIDLNTLSAQEYGAKDSPSNDRSEAAHE